MKKSYIIWAIAVFISIVFFVNILFGIREDDNNASNFPRIGQKLWTYNMNKYEWENHNEHDDDNSKEEIILQYEGLELGTGFTTYKLLTGNYQVPKEDVWIGEGSQEFLIGKNLYSYFPSSFEFYEVIFNGVTFVTKKLSIDNIKTLFKEYKIIKLSDLQKGNYTVERTKNNSKFMIINDGDKDFYKYYIVPNDSKKLEILKFSNSFKVTDDVNIKVQRLEGCTKSYPCYEINVR